MTLSVMPWRSNRVSASINQNGHNLGNARRNSCGRALPAYKFRETVAALRYMAGRRLHSGCETVYFQPSEKHAFVTFKRLSKPIQVRLLCRDENGRVGPVQVLPRLTCNILRPRDGDRRPIEPQALRGRRHRCLEEAEVIQEDDSGRWQTQQRESRMLRREEHALCAKDRCEAFEEERLAFTTSGAGECDDWRVRTTAG